MALAATLFIFIMAILRVTVMMVLGDSMAPVAVAVAAAAAAITAAILMAAVAAVVALVAAAALELRAVTPVAVPLPLTCGIRARFSQM